ncbi:ribonuclease P protein component [Bacteroidetes bacterium endosymbiont of Geopemphigus sp.]|uniref:ribonuclease P protein component n=1 Tax=Bacteroidetes bacterium endosymbiont of Geopemphigus sp. TaxID=2047937 RepID=UPI000CD1C933|nr:ribonuclease P protein component [Bacteroidetes bacterium endosymbiont of Geopemphigus sp.]
MIRNHHFKKYERLKSRQKMIEIFKKGHILQTEALKMIYLKNVPEQKDTQIGVSAPKKFVKKAVERNQIKRRLRSAYRINKHLLNKTETNYSIFFIWMDKELLDFQKTEQLVKRSLFFLTQEKR